MSGRGERVSRVDFLNYRSLIRYLSAACGLCIIPAGTGSKTILSIITGIIYRTAVITNSAEIRLVTRAGI